MKCNCNTTDCPPPAITISEVPSGHECSESVWKPISTAPRYGKTVMVRKPNWPHPSFASFVPMGFAGGWWKNVETNERIRGLTEWLEIPE